MHFHIDFEVQMDKIEVKRDSIIWKSTNVSTIYSFLKGHNIYLNVRKEYFPSLSYLRLQKEARQDVFVFWAEKDIKRRANSSPFYTHDIVW